MIDYRLKYIEAQNRYFDMLRKFNILNREYEYLKNRFVSLPKLTNKEKRIVKEQIRYILDFDLYTEAEEKKLKNILKKLK